MRDAEVCVGNVWLKKRFSRHLVVAHFAHSFAFLSSATIASVCRSSPLS